MRRLSFDYYEFDPSESEQTLDLAISSLEQHPTYDEFLTDCGVAVRPGLDLPEDWPQWRGVTDAIHTRTGLRLAPRGSCEVLALSDDWDDLELFIRTGSVLIWYHWWTTA